MARMTRRQFIGRSAAALVGAAAGLGGYAWRVEPHWVEVVRRPLPIPRLPGALQGRSLVQASDLHVGPGVDDSYLVRALQRIRELRPDILVITGDFVTYRGPDQLGQAARVLDHLPRGRLATLAVLGNHDYGRSWSQSEVGDGIAGLLAERGVTLLRNAVLDVGGLSILGLDDLWGPRFDPAATVRALAHHRPALALAHNPDTADLPVWEGFEGWILSGHTHGGQCKPPFLPPPLLPVRNKRYTAGAFDVGPGRRLYINRGLGHLLPVRFNARPEITHFTLDRA